MSSEVEKEGEGFQEVSRDNGGNGRNYQEGEKIGLEPGETFCLCVSPGSSPVSRFISSVPIHPGRRYTHYGHILVKMLRCRNKVVKANLYLNLYFYFLSNER